MLEWSTADKVTLVALLVLFFVVWYTATLQYLLARPDVATYIDRATLAQYTRVLYGLSALWIAVVVVGFVAGRYSPAAQFPVYVLCLLYAVSEMVAAYLLGLHTSPLAALVALGGITVGLVLFERAPMMTLVAVMLVGAVAMTLAQQLGLLAYAPLMATAPFADGRLATSWLVGVGGVSFMTLCAYVIVVAFVIGRWHEREDQLARANELISRYVASQLAAQIRAGNYAALDRHERRKLTLVFADVQDFSGIADRVEPEDLAAVLNEYLSEMANIGEGYGATIDKFVGDAIMVFFGAPVATNDRDHAIRAVRMALTMQARMTELRTKWQRDGFPHPLSIRIGVNTGQASIGNFGSSHRLDYTAIGRQVNLAARLQTHCAPDGILISHSTWSLVHDEIPCRPIGDITVKGFQQPVAVYQVASDEIDASPVRVDAQVA